MEALGVADCMRSAGLTHGAFYGHFPSRDALIVEALEHAIKEGQQRIDVLAGDAKKRAQTPLQAIAAAFLSERHVKSPGNGCALCALAGEARHADSTVRALLTAYLQELASRMTDAAASDDPKLGLGMLATIVGAVTLARATDDDKLARSILSAALAQVMAQDGAVA